MGFFRKLSRAMSSKKKIQITIGETVLKFKYQNKDIFGTPQESELNNFFTYLNKTK